MMITNVCIILKRGPLSQDGLKHRLKCSILITMLFSMSIYARNSGFSDLEGALRCIGIVCPWCHNENLCGVCYMYVVHQYTVHSTHSMLY